MSHRRLVLGLLLGGGSAVLLALWVSAQRPEALIPLRDPPRPEPAFHREMAPPLLDGLRVPLGMTESEVHAERNRLTRVWHASLDEVERGEKSIYTAEREEARLWLLRCAAGEVSSGELHKHLAYLIERDLRRLELQAEQGLAGPSSLERVRVILERERHLAGLPPGPAAPDGYEALRSAYVQRERGRLVRMVENGMRTLEQARDERENLEREFPAP